MLAGQYESVTLPLAVVLIVPMCLLAAITGVLLRGQDNNILTQIGLVVLVGLACKNAILIVEFAKQAEDQLGLDRFAAAAHAARLRLRPILMTSFAFILGVVPLVIASGAGSEARQALGTAVFAGMIGVTLFGLLFTPAFYVDLPASGALAPAVDRPARGIETADGCDATDHRSRPKGSYGRDAPSASSHRPRVGRDHRPAASEERTSQPVAPTQRLPSKAQRTPRSRPPSPSTRGGRRSRMRA